MIAPPKALLAKRARTLRTGKKRGENMKTLDPNSALAELVLESPARTGPLDMLGVDYCCVGEQSLANACSQKGLATMRMRKAMRLFDCNQPVGPPRASPQLDCGGGRPALARNHAEHSRTLRGLRPTQRRSRRLRRGGQHSGLPQGRRANDPQARQSIPPGNPGSKRQTASGAMRSFLRKEHRFLQQLPSISLRFAAQEDPSLRQ